MLYFVLFMVLLFLLKVGAVLVCISSSSKDIQAKKDSDRDKLKRWLANDPYYSEVIKGREN